MAYGSYSSLTVGSAGGDDYDAIAEQVRSLFKYKILLISKFWLVAKNPKIPNV